MFRKVFLVHLKETFSHFVQLVAPTDQWLATMFQITILNSGEKKKKKGEIWRKILKYPLFCVFKASDFRCC